MRLRQLLEQEGQPCSYCIAVFLMMESGESLSVEEAMAYRRHLLRDHDKEPYAVKP